MRVLEGARHIQVGEDHSCQEEDHSQEGEARILAEEDKPVLVLGRLAGSGGSHFWVIISVCSS